MCTQVSVHLLTRAHVRALAVAVCSASLNGTKLGIWLADTCEIYEMAASIRKRSPSCLFLPALCLQIRHPTSELSLCCRYEVNQAWKASVSDDPDHIRELTQQAFNLLSFEWLQVDPPFH